MNHGRYLFFSIIFAGPRTQQMQQVGRAESYIGIEHRQQVVYQAYQVSAIAQQSSHTEAAVYQNHCI